MDLGIHLQNPSDGQAETVARLVDRWRERFPDDIPQFVIRRVADGVLFAPTASWEPARYVGAATLPDMWQDLYRALHELCYDAGATFRFVTDLPDQP